LACALLGAIYALPSTADPALNGKLQVIHLDAGQGDGAVLITPGGQVVLIDEGTNFTEGSSPASCGRVLSELQALGITHVDLHFASHYHADHIGCITSLTGITIDAGWDRAQSYSSATYTNYTSYLGSKRHTLTKGQTFTLDSLSAHPVTITCVALAGDGISTSDENSKSVVLKVSYGEFDEVFGGDLTGYPSGTSSSNTNIETTVGPQVGKVEVYKVHHHASAYGSYDDWLNATSPKIGIVSCGTGNSYGHPTASALGRLHSHGVRTYWTETGSGVAPDPSWDKVANGEIRINAVWQPGGVDSILAPGIADTLTNSGQAVDSTPPVVSLTAPNGGEVLAAGGTANVTWQATDNVGVSSVDLAYSLDSGTTWSPIAAGQSNTGTFGWSVPNSPTAACRVRVTARDAAGNSASAASAGNVTIADETPPSAQVVRPAGGEDYTGGIPESVVWSVSDNVGVDSVSVEFSLNGAPGSWNMIAHGLPPDPDSVSWTPPDTASDSALVRVTAFDHALNHTTATCASPFHIQHSVSTGVLPGTIVALALRRPIPDPSKGAVTFNYAIPTAGSVRLEVIDVTGRLVWSSSLEHVDVGEHSLQWDGRSRGGPPAPSGTYFVRLSTAFGVRAARFTRLQ
jgi:beta-lactamase superfamily II metal-dependent hydrolase